MLDFPNCEICGKGPEDGISTFRINPKGKGIAGIMRCEKHFEGAIDKDLKEFADMFNILILNYTDLTSKDKDAK
jgi:hypothetical protein